MSWLHGSQLLAGVGALVAGLLLLKLFSATTEHAAARLGALHLIVMPMTVLIILVAGIAFLCIGAGLI